MARRSTISRDDVVDAALEIIDADDGVGSSASKRSPNGSAYAAHRCTTTSPTRPRSSTPSPPSVIGNLDMRHGSDNWVEWLIERGVQFQPRVMEHPNVATLLHGAPRPRATEIGFARGARMLGTAGVPVELQVSCCGAHNISRGELRSTGRSRRHIHPCRARCRSVPRAGGGALAGPDDDGLQSLERAVRGFITGVLIEHAMRGGSPSAADAVADASAVIEPTKEAS